MKYKEISEDNKTLTLLIICDKCSGRISTLVNGDNKPPNISYKDFTSRPDFIKMVQDSRLTRMMHGTIDNSGAAIVIDKSEKHICIKCEKKIAEHFMKNGNYEEMIKFNVSDDKTINDL